MPVTNTEAVVRGRKQKTRFVHLRVMQLLLTLLLFITVKAGANAFGMPLTASGRCPTGSLNVHQDDYGRDSVCYPNVAAYESGQMLAGKGWKIVAGATASYYGGGPQKYVPHAGNYKARAYICPGSGLNTCATTSSNMYIDSRKTVYLDTNNVIDYQDPNFGGAAISQTFNYSFNACYVFIDDAGHMWSDPTNLGCTDVKPLPDNPSQCYLNDGNGLDVDMGQIERSDIPTSTGTGRAGNVKKTISVMCTGDASVTASTSFIFTPLSVNGKNVVTTSIANLGVAIFYNGKAVDPTSGAVTENFSPGYTNRELEFQVVRDKNTPLKDIGTGKFSASAIMVITQQ